MNWITKIWEFIIDPRNRRMLMLAALIIFGLLFFKQCNTIKGLKQDIITEQAESKRIQNNLDASQDSVEMFKTKNGTLVGEIDGYLITVDELKTKYSNLYSDYLKEKNKPPKTIIKTEIEIKEVIKEVPVYISVDSLGNKSMQFNDSIDFKNGNMRWLSGTIPYQLNYYSLPDSTLQHPDSINYYSLVFPGVANFNLRQNMTLTTGLSIDDKTKKPLIWVETKYPGVQFTSIQGAYIMDDPISRKNARAFRREFGFGLSTGYGIMFTKEGYKTGIYVGGGITYTPKWLQFGK